MLHGVIQGCDNVGEIAGAVGGESLQRQNLGARRGQVNQAGSHGAVAEGGVRTSVQNSGRRLIENGGTGLLDEYGLLGATLYAARIELRHVEKFGGTSLVAREVVARKKHGVQHRMRSVDTRVDHRDDSGTSQIESLLRIRETNDLRGGLIHVARDHDGSVIVHGAIVAERRWDAREGLLRQG